MFLLVVIHGLPDLHQPNEHEWFCPVAIEVMAAMAADRPKSRSQSSLSRKSSNSSTRKSSAPPVSANMQTCKPHDCMSLILKALGRLILNALRHLHASFHFLPSTTLVMGPWDPFLTSPETEEVGDSPLSALGLDLKAVMDCEAPVGRVNCSLSSTLVLPLAAKLTLC